MAFEDTKCPCGDKKQCNTMLCETCVDYFSNRREIKDYQDTSLNVELRRHAATTLLTLARDRKRTVRHNQILAGLK